MSTILAIVSTGLGFKAAIADLFDPHTSVSRVSPEFRESGLEFCGFAGFPEAGGGRESFRMTLTFRLEYAKTETTITADVAARPLRDRVGPRFEDEENGRLAKRPNFCLSIVCAQSDMGSKQNRQKLDSK